MQWDSVKPCPFHRQRFGGQSFSYDHLAPDSLLSLCYSSWYFTKRFPYLDSFLPFRPVGPVRHSQSSPSQRRATLFCAFTHSVYVSPGLASENRASWPPQNGLTVCSTNQLTRVCSPCAI